MSSFVGVVEAMDGELLIGGVKINRSSRFEKEYHAQSWCDTVSEDNARAGRKVKYAMVLPNESAPQVLASEVETVH